MPKKSPEEASKQPYEFSQLYYEKKARIQEAGNSDFIEFLNWVENVNKWKKKEDWKKLIDDWFNKYSDWAIIRLFKKFVELKENQSKWYKYENLLNDARYAFNTEVYWENIIGPLFGYYWNYLKYLKNKRVKAEAKIMEEAMEERVSEVLKKRDEEIKEWAENHYGWDDRDVIDPEGNVVLNPKYEHISAESELPEMEEDWQLKIPFDKEP